MPASEQRPTEQRKLSGIFISYRRSDTPDAVGRIYDRLVAEFGKARVFKDVDSIPLGQDFRSHLNEIVGGCAAVLAIVGPRWVDTRNASGQRRLEDPDDFVRIELEAALAREVPVVPVLVGHAPMPGSSELPTSLASMAFRQSIEVRPDPDFHNDATRLVSALWAIVDPDAPREKLPSPSQARSPIWRWLWPTAFLATALAAIALAIPALKHLREIPLPETRTEISVPTQTGVVPTQSGVAGAIALSPDGKQIVFVQMTAGVSRLWLRALAATTAQPLPGTEGATIPFWSPDSRSIGFFTGDALKRMDVGGGVPLTLAPVIEGLGGSWNTDDVILFSQGAGRSLARISATGGPATEVTHVEGDAVALFSPVFLPDGRRFVYGAAGVAIAGIYLGSLDGTVSARLSVATGNIAYLRSGWLLIWEDSRRALIAQRLDADKAKLVGAPVTLVEGVDGAVSASATGLVAYWRGAIDNGKRQLQWRSRTGDLLGAIGEPDETYMSPRVSLDGRVAVVRGESAKGDIWVLEGERASRVTFDGGDNFPVWSPDGTQIAFGSLRTGADGIYVKSADGAGEDRLLQKFSGVFAPASWSADGRNLAYVYIGSRTKMDIGILPLTGDRKAWTFLDTVDFEGAPEVSPDGKWVAYQSNETKRRQVYIRPFIAPAESGAIPATHAGKWQVSTAGGAYPKWSPNGKELFFLNPAGDMMAAPIIFAGSALTPGTPVKLFHTGALGGGLSDGGPQYDVARDGRFLINTVLETAVTEPSPIILIQNWNPDAGK